MIGKFARSAFNSLSSRIMLVFIVSQLAMLAIFTVLQWQVDQQQRDIPLNDVFAFHMISALSAHEQDPSSLERPLEPEDIPKLRASVEDIKLKNPQFRYFVERDGHSSSYGEPPKILPSLREQLRQDGLSAKDVLSRTCPTLFYDSDQIYAFVRQCNGVESAGEVAGIEPGYTPINDAHLLRTPLEFAFEPILVSYALLIILTPMLIFAIMRPIKRAANIARDISPSTRGAKLPVKGMFSEVHGFVEAINKALARLDVGYVREQKFRNAIAHEMNTPLTVLRARLENVEDEKLRTKLVGDIRRMSELVRRLLEFASISAEAINIKEIDLVAEISTTCDSLRSAARAHGLSIELALPHDVDTVLIRANATALFLAINNIINNAIHHSQTGKPIAVRVDSNGTVTIRDHGMGFDASKFGLSEDGQDTAATERKGRRGLGLSITIQVIELIGGSITCKSEPGFGTMFTITLPLAKKSEPQS